LNKATLNIIIAGYIVGGPLGGLAWHHFQYVKGLQALGHNVLFIEDSDDYHSCYNPETHAFSTDPTYGLQFINNLFESYNLAQRWAYYHQPSKKWFGLSEQQINTFVQNTDIFLNLSGINPLRERFLGIPVRVFVDTDPVFTQIKHLTEPAAFNRAMLHNRFFSYGQNFGAPWCSIPDDGLKWRPTRQPIFLKVWNYSTGDKNAKWTTVMHWDSYKEREFNGIKYGMKSSSFKDYFDLPRKITDGLELALGSPTAPRKKLSEAGWHIVDSLSVTRNPSTYQKYIGNSKGEWSIAKHGYAASNSGWFSDRSCCYLATGRPVVIQETGFSRCIETGRGLFSFSSPGEAVSAIEEVNSKYGMHCKYAREIVTEYFKFDKVLNALLENSMASCPTSSI
jgi:hypothetical protein